MTKKPTTVRYTLTEIKQQIARGKDKTRADAPEGPKEDSKFWNRARVVVPPGKTSVHLRVDSDVLEWFKKQGDGHLTRMNAVLRSYVDAHAASVIAGKKRQRARRQKVPNKRPSRKWALGGDGPLPEITAPSRDTGT